MRLPILPAVAIAAIAFPCAARAQSVQVAISALTPLQAAVTDGVNVGTATVPAGVLPATGFFEAALPAALALAGADWQATAGPNGVAVRLRHYVSNPGPVTAVVGAVGTHELLVEMTASAVVDVDLRITRADQLSPGVVSPTAQLDYDNDGIIDVADVPTGQPIMLPRQLSTQPLRVRIVIGATASGAELASSQLLIVATPHNDLLVTQVVTGCLAGFPPPPAFVTPSFVGRGVTLTQSQSPGSPSLMVVGLSPQPALLGSWFNLPCLLLPAPDAVVFEPSGVLQVPLPAALRPLTFHAQGVTWTNGSLLTTGGFTVNAF